MKAARIRGSDEAPVIEGVPTPDPGPDEVLVRAASGEPVPYLDLTFTP